MTIDEVYQTIKYLANKFGYNITPSDFNLMFPRAERQYKENLYVQYGKTQKIDDSISKFLIIDPVFAVDNNGVASLPDDLLTIDSIFKGTKKIQRVQSDRIANHLDSVYDAPDLDFPIYAQYSDYLQFYPANVSTVKLVYIKKLLPAVWGYNLVNGRPVYDATKSTQPEWSEGDLDNIINLFLQSVGVKNRDGELENFAQSEEKTKV